MFSLSGGIFRFLFRVRVCFGSCFGVFVLYDDLFYCYREVERRFSGTGFYVVSKKEVFFFEVYVLERESDKSLMVGVGA